MYVVYKSIMGGVRNFTTRIKTCLFGLLVGDDGVCKVANTRQVLHMRLAICTMFRLSSARTLFNYAYIMHLLNTPKTTINLMQMNVYCEYTHFFNIV